MPKDVNVALTLIDSLESKSMAERKELLPWVEQHKKEFEDFELEIYVAATKRGGLKKLKETYLKQPIKGKKLSELKKQKAVDDWDALIDGSKQHETTKRKRKTTNVTTPKKKVHRRKTKATKKGKTTTTSRTRTKTTRGAK